MPTLPHLIPHDVTSRILLELGIPVHRIGYQQLCVAIPRFAQNKAQSLSKELYPYIAETLGYSDWRAVEHSVRHVILDAWRKRNNDVWAQYFPYSRKPPSSKRFIATLAEYIE